MIKSKLSERDICTKYITPALTNAGWNNHPRHFREEVSFTAGRIKVRGKLVSRGKGKRADYILYSKPNQPIAVIEAKDNIHSIGSGIQQGLEYAEILDLPFVYSSNGDGFVEHDKTTGEERELALHEFPTPDELWNRLNISKGIDPDQEKIITQDYYYEAGGKTPRYYQRVAINRAVEAIIKGQNRILLVMATGTGKTYVAFQIIWRLWKARAKKRILYLTDRNILIDQTVVNDFKPFGDKMTKIKKRHVDKSYEIYMALYQGVSGIEEWKNIYKQFSPDFFDLIIVDECHRGSAAEDSAWREILEYYSSATQIGMTATPRETKYVSNIHYFKEPVYTYSLKQGIEDGFLAPYKVIRIAMDKDSGWRPEDGKVDKYGHEVPDQIYNIKDYDRNLVLEKRTERVAEKVSEFLKKTNRFDKTIIFCENIDHAKRMRMAIVNKNSDEVAKNYKYVMQITGDNDEGKMELDNFITPESKYPVIATTSKLLSTGIDAQTCKLIVLDKNINSMTEFKQIIGRGTRINEEFKKYYFVIMDFRQATNLFADPLFDGDPVQIYEPKEGDPIEPPELPDDEGIDNDEEILVDPEFPESPEPPPAHRRKYYIHDVQVEVISERVQYIGDDGKLITESLRNFTKKRILKEYASLDNFLRQWKKSEKKQAIIEELMEQGILLYELQEEVGKDFDPFDLICHVAFEQPALTRRERANNVKKKSYFTKYGDNARAVLDALLDKYADEGIENLESMEILRIKPFNQFGSPVEIIKSFGGREQYLEAIKELEKQIYEVAA
ncbi:MAG: DEAD/DEAH box helicase family protein [Deltaproteobacteria bacterium]|nr:DEAD/DEAH box helicase family protein [Deltaproteobacteria bacterium]